MTVHRNARVLLLRLVADDAKTNAQLADELGMCRRYVNRVILALRTDKQLFIERWETFERKRKGDMHVAAYRAGTKRDTRPPDATPKAERDRKARELKQARAKSLEIIFATCANSACNR